MSLSRRSLLAGLASTALVPLLPPVLPVAPEPWRLLEYRGSNLITRVDVLFAEVRVHPAWLTYLPEEI